MTDTSPAKPADSAAPSLPHDDPTRWGPRLTRLLDRQIEFYSELETLSADQAQLIEREQTDRLLSLLARRQAIVQQVVDLNQELEPFTRDWERLATRLTPELRESIGKRTARIDTLIGTIAQRDERDREQLETQRATVAASLKSVGSQRSAIAAYQGSGSTPPSPRFQDREG